MPAEPQETTKTYLQINPIEECLKAIGIVHGPEAERNFRYIVARVLDAAEKKENSPPWTLDRIQRILDEEVRYKDWKFVAQRQDVWENGGWASGFRMRAEWMAPDNVTGVMDKQQSRWWVISRHSRKTEIVNNAFLCTKVAEEHELREGFKYLCDGEWTTPYNTHADIDELARASMRVDVRIDTRPEAPANQRRE